MGQTTLNQKTSDFGTFGRYTEIPVDQMTSEQKKGYELVVQERGEAPGPYKIFIQNPHLLQVLVLVGKYFQQSHSSLSDAEREIVVNLINAKWHAAYSNYEHEMIGERAGLPPEKVEALIAGLHTSFDDPRQQVVYDVTCALITPRIVPQGTFMRDLAKCRDLVQAVDGSGFSRLRNRQRRRDHLMWALSKIVGQEAFQGLSRDLALVAGKFD